MEIRGFPVEEERDKDLNSMFWVFKLSSGTCQWIVGRPDEIHSNENVFWSFCFCKPNGVSATWTSSEPIPSHLLKSMFHVPFLVLKGNCHYWTYFFIYFFQGLKQMKDALPFALMDWGSSSKVLGL